VGLRDGDGDELGLGAGTMFGEGEPDGVGLAVGLDAWWLPVHATQVGMTAGWTKSGIRRDPKTIW
jgi:hypothetical protein